MFYLQFIKKKNKENKDKKNNNEKTVTGTGYSTKATEYTEYIILSQHCNSKEKTNLVKLMYSLGCHLALYQSFLNSFHNLILSYTNFPFKIK